MECADASFLFQFVGTDSKTGWDCKEFADFLYLGFSIGVKNVSQKGIALTQEREDIFMNFIGTDKQYCYICRKRSASRVATQTLKICRGNI